MRLSQFIVASVSSLFETKRKEPKTETIADLIRNNEWDPASDGIYYTQPDPNQVLNPDLPERDATSGVPENWEDNPRWDGNPNTYKREMNRCPPGYYSNDRGFCLELSELQLKRRERVKRTKPSRLKNKGNRKEY